METPGVERRRHEDRGAGDRVWRGSVPSPLAEGSWEGLCPSPESVSIFELKKASCGVFWMLFLQLN